MTHLWRYFGLDSIINHGPCTFNHHNVLQAWQSLRLRDFVFQYQECWEIRVSIYMWQVNSRIAPTELGNQILNEQIIVYKNHNRKNLNVLVAFILLLKIARNLTILHCSLFRGYGNITWTKPLQSENNPIWI